MPIYAGCRLSASRNQEPQICAGCSHGSGLWCNPVAGNQHQYSEQHPCRHLRVLTHSIYHTHRTMIPIVMTSFFQGACLSKKRVAAQYGPIAIFLFCNISPGRGHRIIIMRHLHLEYHSVLMAEKIFAPRQIKPSHANKTVVIILFDQVNIGVKSNPPLTQCFGIMPS